MNAIELLEKAKGPPRGPYRCLECGIHEHKRTTYGSEVDARHHTQTSGHHWFRSVHGGSHHIQSMEHAAARRAMPNKPSLMSRARDLFRPRRLATAKSIFDPPLHRKLVKDMIYSAHADAPKEQKDYTKESTPEFNEFSRTFVSPRQNIFSGSSNPSKGSETFGAHVKQRLVATPSGDGMSPGEQTGSNTAT